MKTLVAAWLAVILSACALNTTRALDLAAQFDCLRDEHLAVVAAHRGQPDQSWAENAMSSLAASYRANVPFLEIDVATTSDGVLVLMHDDTLDRTTTGSGRVGDRTWSEIQALKVKRPDGVVLDERVPGLADALGWGKTAGARFELDVKPTTRFSDVVDAVHAARMQDQVLVVTYTLAHAKTIHGLDRRLMISVSMENAEDVAEARRSINPQRLLGWTGTRDPQTRPFGILRAADIEPIFGTLGRPGERLDDIYLADGNPSEYVDLARAGAVMIASDAAVVAQRAIGTGYRRCMK
jgi:glycerophosphoryl diester phosphodiesterase